MAAPVAVLVAAHAVLRVAGGASGVLVGLYLADLARQGAGVTAALVGTLAATTFAAELVGAMPLGFLTDVVTARSVMTTGSLVAAVAAWMFGLTREVSVFFVSRALEGLAVAGAVPALLAHVTDVTAESPARRARVMTYFELSLLAGLALGGLLGSQLWRLLDRSAFTALAGIYLLTATLLYVGAVGSRAHSRSAAVAGLRRSLAAPAVRRLAPMWLCMNAIVGLWLSPTCYFLLTTPRRGGQWLSGVLASQPDRLGWLLLGYGAVFGVGLAGWSVVLPRLPPVRALRVALWAMAAATLTLALLNHAGAAPTGLRVAVIGVAALCVMIESGFAPAALTLLAASVRTGAGRGATMGIYTFLLSVGALVGNLAAAGIADRFVFDGLIGLTLVLVVAALGLLPRLARVRSEEEWAP